MSLGIGNSMVMSRPGSGGPPAGDTDPPGVSGAASATDGTYIDLTIDEDYNTGSLPAAGAFTLTNTFASVASVASQSIRIIRLTLAGLIYQGQVPLLSYTAGGSPIEDTNGNDLPNFSNQAVTNSSTAQTDMVVITRFSNLTWGAPATPGTVSVECWGAGGGGTTAVSAGGGGAYSRVDAFSYTPSTNYSVAIGAGGAAGGGTGTNTTFNSTTCVAAGAVGNTGGLSASCTGDVKRSGGDGTAGAGTTIGGASSGSSTAASGTTPGGPDGAPGGNADGAGSAKIPGGGGVSTAAAQRAGAAGLARLIYQITNDPTLPPLVGFSVTRSTSNATSHTVTIPSGQNGDIVVYIVGSDGNPTISISGSTPICNSANSTTVSGASFHFTANGSEPTSVGLTASEMVNVIVLRFRNAAVPTGTATNASGSNGDPPSHDMGSSAPTTWITTLVVDATSTSGTITARPTNYDESVLAPPSSNTGSVAMMTTWRDATGQTEDPAAFTSTAANVTMTIGIRRAA